MCQFAAFAELSGICARIKAFRRRPEMRQDVKSAKDDQKSADVVRKAEAGRFVPKRMAITLHDAPKCGATEAVPICSDVWKVLKGGERVGIRTQDPLIKSQMLYRLSYALPFGVWIN